MLIRNDDVAFDTDHDQFLRFCQICDNHHVHLLHAITPLGSIQDIDVKWSNEEIMKRTGRRAFSENGRVRNLLLNRTDRIAAHGLYHTHSPTLLEMVTSIQLLEKWGFKVDSVVQPFNEESEYGTSCLGKTVFMKMDRLEDYLPGQPLYGHVPSNFCYLHSWRFGKWYEFDHLIEVLAKVNQYGR